MSTFSTYNALIADTQVIHKRVTKINVLTHSQVVGSYIVPQTSISDNKRTALGAHIAWNECKNSLFQQLTPVMTYLGL